MDVNLAWSPARSPLTTNVSPVAQPMKGSPRLRGADRNEWSQGAGYVAQWREHGFRWPVLSQLRHSLQREHVYGSRSSNGVRGLPARASVQDWNALRPP